jgi:hypothetical protein
MKTIVGTSNYVLVFRHMNTTNLYVQSAFHEKVPAGGVGSDAARGESVLVGGLKGCYWWKTV